MRGQERQKRDGARAGRQTPGWEESLLVGVGILLGLVSRALDGLEI